MTSRNALCSLQGPFPSLRHRRRRIHQKYNHPTSPWGSIRAGSRCWCTRCSWRCRGRRGVSRRFPSPLPDVSRCRSLSPSASTTIPFRFLANVRRAGGFSGPGCCCLRVGLRSRSLPLPMSLLASTRLPSTRIMLFHRRYGDWSL